MLTYADRYRSTNQSSLFNADTEKGLYSTMARLIHTMVLKLLSLMVQQYKY
jgi:hypothetical protein